MSEPLKTGAAFEQITKLLLKTKLVFRVGFFFFFFTVALLKTKRTVKEIKEHGDRPLIHFLPTGENSLKVNLLCETT